MRLVRFTTVNRVKYGVWGENAVYSLRHNPFTHNKTSGPTPILDGRIYKPEEVNLLAPCQPSKIVCLGLNYISHAEETGLPIPNAPLIFLKPSTAVIGADQNIVLPYSSRRVDYEGELGVVIGRRAKNIPKNEVDRYILGYTCFNDVSERHAQKIDGQWTRAKGYDTFAPIGPWIKTDINADDLKLETYLNGELRQSTRTSDLIFGIPKLVSYISEIMTLLPGDVIATGTPSGIGRMNPNDIVEVKIENIGILRNFVIRQEQ